MSLANIRAFLGPYRGRGVGGLVDRLGIEHKPARLPKGIRRAKKGKCFANAYRLSVNGSGLTYVEGYATCEGSFGIPILHGWCVDRDGNVVDPTWDHPERNVYLGIPLKDEFCCRELLANRVFGILACLSSARKMSEMDPAAFLASAPVAA